MTNVITTFKEKRQEKQMIYERKMLRELSLERLKATVNDHFGSYFKFLSAIEDGCIDIAIEAYLLGTKFSRFGYYGESVESIKLRSYYEEKYLADTLYEYLTYWGQVGTNDFVNESLFYSCEYYVSSWWGEGFQKGEKRYRMRLH